MELRHILKSKIHMAAITKTVLDYGGSIGIDSAILEASGIIANERVQVLNFNNGQRIETYVIEEEKNSGTVALYGPAARCGSPGDRISILSYVLADEETAKKIKPVIIMLNGENRVGGS